MSSGKDIIDAYKDHSQDYFAHRNAYSTVHALLLWWQENDIHPEKEISALKSLLENDFRFQVSTFQIPKDGTHKLSLKKEIMNTVENHSNKNSLLIVYYAGHCDPDERGRARWAAFEKGEPTLSWYVSQQLLFDAEGDVLLILDCCNAASIAAGVKETGRFEMIAACAENNKTVAPSNSSFTRILIKELKPMAESGVYTETLASKIRENGRITETPVFHDFAQKSDTKIWLRRLQDQPPQGFSKKPAGYMVFLVSLDNDIKGQTIANWLKVAAPKEVTAVDIEALVLRARQLEGLQDGAFTPGSMLSKLSQSAKSEILQALQGLHTTMALTSQHAENDQAPESEGKTTRLAQTDFGAIQRSVSAVCSAVETPVLQDLNETDQRLTAENPLIVTTRTRDALSLRKAVLSPTVELEDVTEIPSEKLRYDRNSDDVSTRKLATLGQDQVLIEIFHYDDDPQDEHPAGPHQQVQRMAKLLSQAEPLNFHVLRCQGFFHNAVRREIGLVFKPPCEMNDQVQLTTLLQLYARYPVMPLGHRIHLAQSLVNAIDHFHRVGWVHKSIRSNNILFIPSSIGLDDGVVEEASHHESGNSSARWKGFELSNPYIFGFEYARPGEVGTSMLEDYSLDNNLYRHPDRWGNPRVKFEKVHDIYALAIVLLEIAFWKDIKSIVLSKSRRVVAKDVRSKAKDMCQSQLPHRVGHLFAQAILTCLDFADLTEGMNEYECQTYFQRNVNGRMRMVAGQV